MDCSSTHLSVDQADELAVLEPGGGRRPDANFREGHCLIIIVPVEFQSAGRTHAIDGNHFGWLELAMNFWLLGVYLACTTAPTS